MKLKKLLKWLQGEPSWHDVVISLTTVAVVIIVFLRVRENV